MNLKEKIIHLMFQTRPITRLHKYSQVKLKLTLHLYLINIHQPLLKLYGCRSPLLEALISVIGVGSHVFQDDNQVLLDNGVISSDPE